MNSIKFTDRAREAIENAIQLSQTGLNTTVEPEHLLKAILESKSVLNQLLHPQQLEQLSAVVSLAISQMARTASPVQAQMSQSLHRIITAAPGLSVYKSTGSEYVAVHHLLLSLLGHRTVAVLFEKAFADPTVSALCQAIEEDAKGKKMTSAGADDPEDKMSKFATEMVEQARRNKYDPVIGRDSEIRQVIEVLAKKSKSNVILVGKPGVGKTAIVRGIAQLIAHGSLEPMRNYKIYSVDVGAMVAGACHRGDFEERLKGLVAEAESSKQVVLFIDEIHIVLGAGKTDGSLDAANILKPGLADGSLRVIGATTYDEYRKYVCRDPAFERRFTRVDVREPSVEDTITLMRGLRERLEMHHGVKISDKALVYASSMGKRYIANRRLPDLAIDLVDAACAASIISLNTEPAEIAEIRSRIWRLELEKTSVEMDMQREAAGTAKEAAGAEKEADVLKKERLAQTLQELHKELAAKEEEYNQERSHLLQAKEMKKKLEDARNRMEQAKRDNNKYLVWDLQTNIIPVYEKQLSECNNKVEVIGPQHIAAIISRWSGIPVQRISLRESDRLLSMGERIKKFVYGQDRAVDTVVDSILANRAGLSRDNKPIGSFLFIGPTGVGKTELAKTICTELNGTCESMVVLDMSDYANEISLTKLIGAPAGYVGCEEGGALTEPVKERPYNVVLLDEVDLAHQSVLNVLYQLLDEGRVTDGRGVRVSFRNTVVIMTTNLGQEHISCEGADRAAIEQRIIARFGQPLINRIDNVVIFNHLDRASLRKIIEFEIDELNSRMAERNAGLTVSDEVLDYAVDQACGSAYGARVLKRFVKDNFVGVLTRLILSRSGDAPLNVSCFMNSEGREGLVSGNYTFVVD